jgi:hypothetical protein
MDSPDGQPGASALAALPLPPEERSPMKIVPYYEVRS